MGEYETRFGQKSCRVCGCTEDRACPGGCWWVAPGLCSACAPEDPPHVGVVPLDTIELADAVAATFLEECYRAALELGLVDELVDELAVDLTAGGW